MSLTVMLFGPYADAAGRRRIEVRAGDCGRPTAQDVLVRVGQCEPRLAPLLARARLAVNGCYAPADQPVSEDDELAVIGMVGGG